MSREQQRAALHRTIWKIANDLCAAQSMVGISKLICVTNREDIARFDMEVKNELLGMKNIFDNV